MTRRVVIAEDEAIIRLDLKEILLDEGYDVVGETGRGDEAVDLVRANHPDLVILDVKMPGSDGLAAARAIRDLDVKVAVLILTAFSQRNLIDEAREAGVAAYLVKPFQRIELMPAIDQAMARCEQEWAIDAEAAPGRGRGHHRQSLQRRGQTGDPPSGRRGQGRADGAVRHVRIGGLRLHPEDGDGHPVPDDRRGPAGARRQPPVGSGRASAMATKPPTTTVTAASSPAASGSTRSAGTKSSPTRSTGVTGQSDTAVSTLSPKAGDTPTSRPLILLDGMSLAFRAYFALPPDLATSAGVVTNAVHGFASMVVNLVRDHRPVGLAVAFDLPGATFRDDIVDDYKGGRSETPPDLPPQFDLIRNLLESLAIPVVAAEGYEADDVLATLATEARDRGHPVIIVTGDRDSYQLVEDPYIQVLYNRRGVSDYALYDEAGIAARTGVAPEKYPLLAALRGDPSDNLPGVPGVGEKTAAKLVNEYGDLDALYAHLDALSPKLRENLAAHSDQVRRNAEVIPLVRDVPLDVHVDQLVLGGWDLEAAHQAFAELELRQLWSRFTALMGEGAFGEPAAGSSVPPGSTGQAVAADPVRR